MNRAVRRQSVKEPKTGKRAAAPTRPVSRRGPGRAAPRREGRTGGPLSWRPRFALDIISELRKVSWPTRQDTVHLTVAVVIVTLALGAILGAIDIGFGWLIDNTILRR